MRATGIWLDVMIRAYQVGLQYYYSYSYIIIVKGKFYNQLLLLYCYIMPQHIMHVHVIGLGLARIRHKLTHV